MTVSTSAVPVVRTAEGVADPPLLPQAASTRVLDAHNNKSANVARLKSTSPGLD